MLRIYPVIIEMIESLRPVLAEIERRDCDLARQMRRAASSVALNVAEGAYSRGRNRTARYHTALGSMQETRACLDVAAAFGYLGALDEQTTQRMAQVTGTLVRLVRGPG